MGKPITALLLSALSEKEFQRQVVSGLRQRGWIVWTVPNMRLTTAGLPDILAIHADRPTLIAWELKREKNSRTSPIQKAVLTVLSGVPGVDARIVKPSDWAELSREV